MVVHIEVTRFSIEISKGEERLWLTGPILPANTDHATYFRPEPELVSADNEADF